MNSRERVLTALNHKEPDRVPLDLGAGLTCKMHVKFYRNLLEHFGMREGSIVVCNKAGQTALASDALLERLGCDIRVPFPTFRKKPDPKGTDWEDGEYTYYRDDWGTVCRMPKSAPLYYDMCQFPLIDAEEGQEAAYPWPEPYPINPDGVEQAQRYHAAGYPVAFIDHFGNGFLQTGPRLYGFDNWLTMLALEEERVRRFLEKLLELKMRHYDNVLAAYGDGLDLVCESDDLGTQTGPFVSPDMFRELFKPYWKRLFDHIRKKTKAKIYLHCCGACEPMLRDLIEVGLDILNPVQISAAGMDPLHLKREYGRDLVFWGGGVDTQRVLPRGTPAEIRDHVRRNIEALAPGGGFVFATVHNVQADVPVGNFIAMWEAFREYAEY